jgi:hypothetical protein
VRTQVVRSPDPEFWVREMKVEPAGAPRPLLPPPPHPAPPQLPCPRPTTTTAHAPASSRLPPRTPRAPRHRRPTVQGVNPSLWGRDGPGGGAGANPAPVSSPGVRRAALRCTPGEWGDVGKGLHCVRARCRTRAAAPALPHPPSTPICIAWGRAAVGGGGGGWVGVRQRG